MTSSQNKIYKCNPDFNFLPRVLQAHLIRELGMKYYLRGSDSKRGEVRSMKWAFVGRKSPRLDESVNASQLGPLPLSLQVIYCLLVRAEREI